MRKKSGSYTDEKNEEYFIKSNGNLASSEFIDAGNGKKQYCDAGGKILKNRWVKTRNGDYYCLDANGYPKSGWVTWQNKKYYLDPATNIMVVNTTKEIDGKTYTFDQTGAVPTGWFKVNGSWRYNHDDGHAAKDEFVVDEGKRYYLDNTGRMLTGNFSVNGKAYFAWSDGWISSRLP